MDSENIRELIEKARGGDTVAVGELIAKLRPLLLKQVQEQLDSDLYVRSDPSDVIQQTALEIHRDFHTFRGDAPGELVAWIKQILRNNIASTMQWHVFAQKRAKNREQNIHDSDGLQHIMGLLVSSPKSSPTARAISREDTAILADALQRLPDDQRDAVRLRHLEGWSLRQLAEHFDRSEVAVAGLLKRGMKKLRQFLAPKKED